MTIKSKHIIVVSCVVLLLCAFVLFSRVGVPTVVKLGSSFTVDNTSESRILLNHIDTLARDGLYYAAWGIGEKEDCKDTNGKTISLHDAQIYFLLGEYPNVEQAEENMQVWLDTGRTNYEVVKEDTILFCGEECTRLIYRFADPESLYANGVSIFGVLENSAVCIELTCRETFTGDQIATMEDFLGACTHITN